MTKALGESVFVVRLHSAAGDLADEERPIGSLHELHAASLALTRVAGQHPGGFILRGRDDRGGRSQVSFGFASLRHVPGWLARLRAMFRRQGSGTGRLRRARLVFQHGTPTRLGEREREIGSLEELYSACVDPGANSLPERVELTGLDERGRESEVRFVYQATTVP